MKKQAVTEAVQAILHSESPVGKPLTTAQRGDIHPPVPPTVAVAPASDSGLLGRDRCRQGASGCRHLARPGSPAGHP